MRFVRKLLRRFTNNEFKYGSINLPLEILQDWGDVRYVELVLAEDCGILVKPYS